MRIFSCLFALLLLPLLAQAETFQLLDRGDQSLAAYYTALSGAQESIDLATYVFEPCHSSTKLLLEAIVARAKAGVKVRIMLDAYSLSDANKAGIPAYLASASKNIEVRYYNDTGLLTAKSFRSHIKVLVVDAKTPRRLFFVGGRNLSDDYFGLSAKMNYVDQDLMIRGYTADVAHRYYEELWNNASPPSVSGNSAAFARNCMAPTSRDLEVAKVIKSGAATILASRPVRVCGNMKYALDNPEFLSLSRGNDLASPDPLDDDDKMHLKRTSMLVLGFLEGVKSDLRAANQYFIPAQKLETALRKAGSNGKVEIFTNSTGDVTDFPSVNDEMTCWIQSSSVTSFGPHFSVNLLSSKGSMGSPWELSVRGAPWRIHTKSAVRDRKDVLMSSFNFDPRSYNINLESGAVISDCPELAADLEAQYDSLESAFGADRNCSGCRAELKQQNLQPGISCGMFKGFL